jgi:photosystem II stability/assembly factor-like uncharacterized protein
MQIGSTRIAPPLTALVDARNLALARVLSAVRDVPHRRARRAFGAVTIACIVGASSAGAGVSQAGKPIVGLAFDAGTHTLLKADADGLYRSTLDGSDWQALRRPETAKQGRIAAIAISPRAPHALYVAGPGLGVQRSADGGQTWTAKGEGLPSLDVIAVTAHADQPATVYVYIDGKGIFRSEDAGDHWRLMGAGPRGGIVQFVHSNLPESMQTGWLFAATAAGVGRSMDCFCGWHDAGGLGRPAIAVAYDPREPKRVYAATADGLAVSEDGGEQWSSLRSPGRIAAMIATADDLLIAAGDPAALFRSTDHGRTWRRLDE